MCFKKLNLWRIETEKIEDCALSTCNHVAIRLNQYGAPLYNGNVLFTLDVVKRAGKTNFPTRKCVSTRPEMVGQLNFLINFDVVKQ